MPSFTAVTLADHPPTLREHETALLTEAIGKFGLRGNQMTRDLAGRLYAGVVGVEHYLVDEEAVSTYRKVSDTVVPSPNATQFLTWQPKGPVEEFTHGTHEPTSTIFAYPEHTQIWGADYVGDGDQAVVMFSDDDNHWLVLCERTESGWVEVDNARLRTTTSLAALGEIVILGTTSGKKLQVYGVRDGRLYKLGTVNCAQFGGEPRRLPHDGEWTLMLATLEDSKAAIAEGLDALWSKAKSINAKPDTHLLKSFCGGIETQGHDDEVEAKQKAAYEAFAETDETVEGYIGATADGFVARWPDNVLRHVRIDGDSFETGPELATPGKRFESWVAWTRRFGEHDILEMSGGKFIIP